MKKILFAIPLFLIGLLSGCSQVNTKLTFAQHEYSITSGEAVLVNEHSNTVNYQFVGEVPYGVSLDKKNGVITFDDTIYNSSQVLYQAYNEAAVSDMVVITLLHEQREGNLTFLNLTNKIIDGDYVIATNSEGHAIKYELKDDVYGVSIDASSGRVSFTQSCPHNQEFTVVISSKNTPSQEMTFYTAIENLVVVKNDAQACEDNSDVAVSYILDYSAASDSSFLGVMHDRKFLNEEDYTYDEVNSQVYINASYLNEMNFGDSTLSIITSTNNINVSLLKATKFIRTAEDLASINDSVETLSGHYILTNDIDLSSYLAMGGDGYNDGKGWDPIGSYKDVTDGTATELAFNGTFDGNGYAISGLNINRTDEKAYNAGLFGYVDSLALIKNLTVRANMYTPMSVRSFSGVLAGNNQGRIENCYVQGSITNYSGENLFKNLGVVCGTNGGEIVDTIAYGTVTGDAYYGILAGSNEGVIENCYSVSNTNEQIGVGNAPLDSYHFATIGELQAFDFSGKLDPNHWQIAPNSTPKTKQYLEFFSIYSLEILGPDKDFFTKGDIFSINVRINPINLYDEYISLVEYTVTGEGMNIQDNVVRTENATVNEFKISVSLTAQGKTYTDAREYILYDVIEEIVVDESVETIMNAGMSYRLKANVYPLLTADQNVSWKLAGTYKGISIEEDVVTIADDCIFTSFSVYAYNGSIKSDNYTININTFKSLDNGSIVMYKDELADLVYTFTNGEDLDGVKAYIDNAQIEIKEITDTTITISKEYIELIPDKTLKFKFVLTDGSMYHAYATYFTRNVYDLDYVKENHTEYHTISSVEDFATYFNVIDSGEEGLGYSSDKYKYYDDVFVLTNDIDFEGGKMFGIGTYDSDADTGAKFEGTIYGQGYSFKNINITDNEKWFTNEDKTGKWRNSLYAVGFFGTFDGEIYDVNFDNIHVSSNNWVAGFACTIGTNGYLENVHFTNSSVTSTGGTQGKLYCTNNGGNNLVVVSYNGQLTNLGR